MDHVQRCLAFAMAVSFGQVALHDQAVAVLHQRVPKEAQHGRGAGGLLVKPRVGVSRGGMGGVGALLALEIEFGIAVGFGVAGHRVGLGWGFGRCGLKRGIGSGRIAGA